MARGRRLEVVEQPKKEVDKHQRFIELADRRVGNLLRAFEMVRQLTNTDTYKYEADEAEAVLEVVRRETQRLERQFKLGGPKKSVAVIDWPRR